MELVGDGAIADEGVLVHTGDHAAKLTAGASFNTNIRQDSVAVIPGKTYTLSFYTRGDGANQGRYGVYDNINTEFILFREPTGVAGAVYTLVEYEFDAPQYCTSINVYFQCPEPLNGIAYFDTSSLFANYGGPAFLGTISAIRPTSGLFEYPTVEVEVQDWMGLLSTTELGVIPIAEDKRVDEALTTTLTTFPIQPFGTALDEGVETFPLVFNTDHPETSVASFFQKMCRNEQGRIYLKADGTLVFENRYARPITTASAFTLDGTMSYLDVDYERREVFNFIRSQITPAKVDAAATTILWALEEVEAPSIGPGETLTFTCDYSDPDTGVRISAIDVVDPVITVKFGSVGDFTADDMAGDLVQSNTVGGNAIECALTNDHPYQTGYLNEWAVKGKGIYVYNPMTLVAKNQDSIDIRGNLRYRLRLNQITDPNKAYNYAAWLKNAYGVPSLQAVRVIFLANQTEALTIGAVDAEISTRFTLIEAATGVSKDFFINKIKYTHRGRNLWVEILAKAAKVYDTFIWDSSHWDNEEDARWAL